MANAVADNVAMSFNQSNVNIKTLAGFIHSLEERFGSKAKIQVTSVSGNTFTVTVYKTYVA